MSDPAMALLSRDMDTQRQAVRERIMALQPLDFDPGIEQDIRHVIKRALMTCYVDSLYDAEVNTSYHPKLEWAAIELLDVVHEPGKVEVVCSHLDRPVVLRVTIQELVVEPMHDLNPERKDDYHRAVAETLLDLFKGLPPEQIPEPLSALPIHLVAQLLDTAHVAKRKRDDDSVTFVYYDNLKREITLELHYRKFLELWFRLCSHLSSQA